MKSLEKLDSKRERGPDRGQPLARPRSFARAAHQPNDRPSRPAWLACRSVSGPSEVSRRHRPQLAYGEEVRAAAGGVVTFAGEQPGYGLVVKVDHGDGLETRYAHLSSMAVRAGVLGGRRQPDRALRKQRPERPVLTSISRSGRTGNRLILRTS